MPRCIHQLCLRPDAGFTTATCQERTLRALRDCPIFHVHICHRRSCAWWHLVDDVQFCSSGASHAVRPYAITKPRPSLYTYTLIPTVLASVSSYSSSLTEVSCVSINSPSRLPSVNLPFLPSALFNFSLSSLLNLSLYTS